MKPLYQLTKVKYPGHLPTSGPQKAIVAATSAIWSLIDPRRADMVGTLGEVTGRLALERLRNRLLVCEDGKALLRERPKVTSQAHRSDWAPDTFGAAYAHYMAKHSFQADDRTPVALVDDEELAYILLRYRQVHDYWHVLCDLPPSLLGELALKWFELFQTGLPLCAFSAIAGPIRLSTKDCRLLYSYYLPWAQSAATKCKFLLAVPYEAHLDDPIDQFRSHLNLTKAPPKPLS
mmetsp:Transcript_6074/g.8992  ORF Transcript_6074/g.8992 Transcript_6074/m.8992 type:complete len:234 (-) Transcript_6074:911-1612(-)